MLPCVHCRTLTAEDHAAVSATRNERLDARVTREEKKIIEEAPVCVHSPGFLRMAGKEVLLTQSVNTRP